jgi:competence protein ComGE
MLRNCKGFTLIDALLGLSILSLFFTFALPYINDLIRERKIVTEKMFVLTTLHNDLQHWLYDDYNNMKNSTKLYTPLKKELHVNRSMEENRKIQVCITWDITDNRKEELCLYGHKAK